MRLNIGQITHIDFKHGLLTIRDYYTGRVFKAKLPLIYHNPMRNEFAGYLPEAGSWVYFVEKEGVAFVVGYIPFHFYDKPAFIDPYYKPEYGSFFATTRARNFLAVRRSGTIEVHSTPACTKLYMQKDNTIIQHFWNYFEDTPCMDFNYEYDWKNKQAWWRQHLWRWKDKKEKKYWWIESPKDKKDDTWLHFKGEDTDKQHKVECDVFNKDSSLTLHLEYTPQKTIDVVVNKDTSITLKIKFNDKTTNLYIHPNDTSITLQSDYPDKHTLIKVNPADTNIYMEIGNDSNKSKIWADQDRIEEIVGVNENGVHFIKESSGHIKLENKQGSYIEFTTDGDIIIKSAKNIHLNP